MMSHGYETADTCNFAKFCIILRPFWGTVRQGPGPPLTRFWGRKKRGKRNSDASVSNYSVFGRFRFCEIRSRFGLGFTISDLGRFRSVCRSVSKMLTPKMWLLFRSFICPQWCYEMQGTFNKISYLITM